MKITVLCAGKLKEKYWTGAAAEYIKRLSRYGSVNIEEVPDEAAPESASAAQRVQILEREAERFLRVIRRYNQAAHCRVIALAIDGKTYDSAGFSRHLDELRVSGTSHIVFVIGGSLGLAAFVLKEADEKISFSAMTFPHQLMRIILLEQIYRAERISRGEPYDK